MAHALAHSYTLEELTKNPEAVEGLVKDCATCDDDTPGHVDRQFCPTCKGKGTVPFGEEIKAIVKEIEASTAETSEGENFFDEFDD